MLHGKTAVYFDSLFKLDKSGSTEEHSLKLKKRRINAHLRQHFFFEKIVNIWNALEDELVEYVPVH